MQLIDTPTKQIMENCKVKARAAGLKFPDETLEYIVTNKDLIKLSPKNMIPTLYDYWVHDLEVLQGQGIYKISPSNPYETVINSRPPISFYNDNNPDWLNTMIFYHVLGHIDCFQNNIFFKKTWNDDFVGKALADKRIIEDLRSKHGRWVDYVIEFSRGIDNITGYFKDLAEDDFPKEMKLPSKSKFYFDYFLQGKATNDVKVPTHKLLEELEKYNHIRDKSENERIANLAFFAEVEKKHPEFESLYKKYNEEKKERPKDLMEFLMTHSPKLKQDENKWMKRIMQIVRDTGVYFAPQGRTKIINEGWASYWHDELFRQDEGIRGHEVDYAKINARVTALPRFGLNPYAIGVSLIQYVEELANKGKLDYNFQKIHDIRERKFYNQKMGKGKEAIFKIRKYLSDFSLINTFVDQDFVDKHNLFVAGKRLNTDKMMWDIYIQSRKAEDYKKMLLDSLYHPPHITVNKEKTSNSNIYLVHHFEGKRLMKEWIPNTMLGIEFLWGNQVQLETYEEADDLSDMIIKIISGQNFFPLENEDTSLEYQKVLYTMKDRKIEKKIIKDDN